MDQGSDTGQIRDIKAKYSNRTRLQLALKRSWTGRLLTAGRLLFSITFINSNIQEAQQVLLIYFQHVIVHCWRINHIYELYKYTIVFKLRFTLCSAGDQVNQRGLLMISICTKDELNFQRKPHWGLGECLWHKFTWSGARAARDPKEVRPMIDPVL